MGERHDPKDPFFPTMTCQSGPNSWSMISLSQPMKKQRDYCRVPNSDASGYTLTRKYPPKPDFFNVREFSSREIQAIFVTKFTKMRLF